MGTRNFRNLRRQSGMFPLIRADDPRAMFDYPMSTQRVCSPVVPSFRNPSRRRHLSVSSMGRNCTSFGTPLLHACNEGPDQHRRLRWFCNNLNHSTTQHELTANNCNVPRGFDIPYQDSSHAVSENWVRFGELHTASCSIG